MPVIVTNWKIPLINSVEYYNIDCSFRGFVLKISATCLIIKLCIITNLKLIHQIVLRKENSILQIFTFKIIITKSERKVCMMLICPNCITTTVYYRIISDFNNMVLFRHSRQFTMNLFLPMVRTINWNVTLFSLILFYFILFRLYQIFNFVMSSFKYFIIGTCNIQYNILNKYITMTNWFLWKQ